MLTLIFRDGRSMILMKQSYGLRDFKYLKLMQTAAPQRVSTQKSGC